MPQLVAYADVSIADLDAAALAGTLYAVLDACDEPAVPVKVRELGPAAATLYPDALQEEMWGIAPYLVTVSPATLRWIAETKWTGPWGVLILAAMPLEQLRLHVRKFIIVHSPDGHESFFRFYDPRVLASLFATYDATQLAELFGPVTAFGWLDDNGTGGTLARRAFVGDPVVPPRITMRRPAGL